MRSGMIAALIVGALVLVGYGVFLATKSSENITSKNMDASNLFNNSTNQDKENNSQQIEEFTKDQISTHNNKDDCWTIIDGTVYNITSYIPRHPGGEEILRACGTDGSSLFKSRTTDKGEKVGSGAPHSSNANNQLANLKVGILAN